jgi:hypothetical protein
MWSIRGRLTVLGGEEARLINRLLTRAARKVSGINNSFQSRDRQGAVLGPRNDQIASEPPKRLSTQHQGWANAPTRLRSGLGNPCEINATVGRIQLCGVPSCRAASESGDRPGQPLALSRCHLNRSVRWGSGAESGDRNPSHYRSFGGCAWPLYESLHR